MTIIFATLNLKSQIVFNGSVTKSGTGVSSLTFTKTLMAGNNVLLIVGVTVQDKNITNVSFAGTNLTQFALATRNSMRVGLYYRAIGNLAVSVTSNVVVSLAASSDAFAGAADYSGVWQAAPFVNPTVAQAKNNHPSVTFTSAVGHKAISLLGDISATPIANGAGQTQYWTFTGSHSNRACEKNGAPSITMSHTLNASEDWVMIGGTMQDYAVITLPIELTEFKAERTSLSNVNLNWQTTSELNNDYFSLERSLDGFEWKEVAKIKGAGTSSVQKKYMYVDKLEFDVLTTSEEAQLIYYRLTQVDFNGSKKAFEVIYVEPFESDKTELMIFPNPTSGDKVNLQIELKYPIPMAKLQVISSIGQVVYSSVQALIKGTNHFQLNYKFEKGVYFTMLFSDNTLLGYKKLVIK